MPKDRATALRALCLGFLFAAAAIPAAVAEPVAVRGAGATFPAPLYKKWAELYGKQNAGVVVSYESVGSGEGVRRFIAGGVDFGASDRPPGAAELAKAPQGGVLVPATAGMVVIAYSLTGLDKPLLLPRDVYVDIFAGRIRRWDDARLRQANPGVNLPARNIALIVRLDGSGTTYAFTNHLATVSRVWRENGPGVGTLVKWPSNALLARGNEGVSHLIKISEGAIGYVEYGFAKRLGLPTAALQNRAGNFIVASDTTAIGGLTEALADPQLQAADPTGADAYPIVTYSWLLLYKSYAEPTKARAVKDFVTWGLTLGQKSGVDLGYVPLPPAVVARAEAELSGVR